MCSGRRATLIRQQRFLGTVFSWQPDGGYGFIDVHATSANVRAAHRLQAAQAAMPALACTRIHTSHA